MMFFCYFTVYYVRFFSVLSGLVRPCTQAMFLTTFPTLISFCYIREVCDSLLMDANTTFHRFVLCALVPPLLLNTNATLSLKPQTLHALNNCQTPWISRAIVPEVPLINHILKTLQLKNHFLLLVLLFHRLFFFHNRWKVGL